jgi:hypothetical protein
MDNQGLRLERQGGTTGESWGLPPCSPNPISQEAESSKASTQARESTRSGPTTTRSLMPLGLSNAARVWTYHRSTPASAKRMVHRAATIPPPPYPCLPTAHKRPTKPLTGQGRGNPGHSARSLLVLSWVSQPCGAEIKCLQLAQAAWCLPQQQWACDVGSTRVPCVRGCPADTPCGHAPRNMEGRRLNSSRRSRNLRRLDR